LKTSKSKAVGTLPRQGLTIIGRKEELN